jgi:hypothetical protein
MACADSLLILNSRKALEFREVPGVEYPAGINSG